MKQIFRILFVLLMLPLVAYAGDGAKGEKKESFVKKGLMWVKTTIDTMAVAKVDRSYIEQPKRPWSIELRNEFSESFLKMTTEYPLTNGNKGTMDVRTSSGFTAATGLWVGYRGYGFGWSKNLTGAGSVISFGAMGGSFGLNMRINSYRSSNPEASISIQGAETSYHESGREDLEDPIHVRSFFLDGYYMFNGKRFSYAAAYDQSLIQRRSAGSLMAGAMYFHSRVSFDDPTNWPMMVFTRGVGKIKFTQASIGLGYAYNWVPARGWLVSVQVMPMLQFYNRMKIYNYGVEYVDGDTGNSVDLVKTIGENIEQVLIQSASQTETDIDDSEYDDDYIRLTYRGEEKTDNKIGFNFDGRLSVVHNWEKFYLRVYGHYNRFRYSNDLGNGRMTEWRAYAALGYRF